jgi:hypothetical protein
MDEDTRVTIRSPWTPQDFPYKKVGYKHGSTHGEDMLDTKRD